MFRKMAVVVGRDDTQRFVEQNVGWVGGECAGDLDAAAFAAGKRDGRCVSDMGNAEFRQQVFDEHATSRREHGCLSEELFRSPDAAAPRPAEADLDTRFRTLVQSPLRAGLLRYLSANPEASYDVVVAAEVIR